MNRLMDYLRQHIMIDFQGDDLTVAKVRELLAGDDSRDAKQILTKLVADKSIDDLLDKLRGSFARAMLLNTEQTAAPVPRAG